ncbi:MAG: conserved hypothetical phage tail protein [Frankiales bacterium]|nr:conserved hypothetical phage tail protein [Frankiales bacterium]
MTTPAVGMNPVQNVAVTTWYLDASGTSLAAFKTISGISLELNVVEMQHTIKGGKTSIMKSVNAGGVKPGKLTCTRGLILDDSMWTWIQDAIDGNMAKARKNITIILYNADGSESKRYEFRNAFPSGWSLGDLDAAGTDALMETLTIEHEGFSLKGKNGF